MKLDELKIVRAALGTNPDPMASKARMIVNGYISQLEGKANQAKNDFAHYASHYGLRPDQLGKVFKCQGTLYRIKEADQGFIVGAAAMNKGGKPGDVPTFVPPGPTKLEKGHTYCAYNQGNTITPQMKRVTIVHLNDQDVYYRIAGETEVKQTPIERFREIIGDKPREAT